MKNEKDHLPIYGPGPIFGGVVIALTVAAVFCRNLPVFQCGNIAALRIPLIVIGIILILFAVFLWVYAVIITKIDDGILHNHLVTTGAYALVRNPIYSAILILCTGVLMIGGNVLFLILPFLYWAFLTVLLKNTEEKWLSELYGEEYKEYCKKVNRCIPWFPKKKRRIWMSKKASNFQKKAMSFGYRGKEIFKPLNTGWIDEHVACVREWIANIFFYTKNGTTVMIDAGYNYDRLKEKMTWLDIDPSTIRHILITHQDTDHVGAVETDSGGLFQNATLYLSEIENKYLTGEVRRKVIFGLYKLPMVKSDNQRFLLQDGQVLDINGIKVECILCPGHTWGHMVYLIDDEYLFTGDTIWFGADGGYSFINSLAEDNELAKRSLAELEQKLKDRGLTPKVITGHTGWTDDFEFVFRHKDKICNSLKKQKPHDPSAPYDGYKEDDDTEANARSGYLPKVVPVSTEKREKEIG